jgi:hypothetical protein
MATATGLTKERMLEIEAASVVDGEVVGSNLILYTHDGTPIDAGPVIGADGGFEMEQSFAVANTVWDFVHGQGTNAVNVYTQNSLGVEIRGEISYPNDDTVRVTFYHAQTGLGRVWN